MPVSSPVSLAAAAGYWSTVLELHKLQKNAFDGKNEYKSQSVNAISVSKTRDYMFDRELNRLASKNDHFLSIKAVLYFKMGEIRQI